ncbi:hypothetical protein, partial [Corynebacterium striatum]|uniref:hypothetical protein n=1 Tax=Corynebacterium striatum TaxID=43770 RepID=UPI0014195534
TPPAFVLSQDQTLHKKISAQKPKNQAVKSPNLTKRQTNQNQQRQFLIRLANPKITIQRKITTTPQPDGAKKGGSQTTKNDSRNLNAYQTNKLNYLQSRPKRPDPAHTTPTKHLARSAQSRSPQSSKKYIGTLLSSQTSSPHNKQPPFK